MKKSLLAFALAIATIPMTFAAQTKPAVHSSVKTGSSFGGKSTVASRHNRGRKRTRTASHRRTAKKGVVRTASVRSASRVKPR
jgi:hypothetical protein